MRFILMEYKILSSIEYFETILTVYSTVDLKHVLIVLALRGKGFFAVETTESK